MKLLRHQSRGFPGPSLKCQREIDTGAAALRADTPFDWARWAPAFLGAVAAEAADGRQLLLDLERAWFGARTQVAGRRRDSHAAAAVDRLAAVPLLSATSLAAGLGIAVKNAIRLLEDFVDGGIAVEVTHRSRRRLFGLTAMAPLAEAVRPPYRPEPGRGRGRPPGLVDDDDDRPGPPPPPPQLPPLTPMERRAFDYGDFEADMTNLDRLAGARTGAHWKRLDRVAGSFGQPAAIFFFLHTDIATCHLPRLNSLT